MKTEIKITDFGGFTEEALILSLEDARRLHAQLASFFGGKTEGNFNWQEIESVESLPKNERFLLWNHKQKDEQLYVYEAEVQSDLIFTSDTGDELSINDFSHWCRIVGPK
jgi:hypothetical protein